MCGRGRHVLCFCVVFYCSFVFAFVHVHRVTCVSHLHLIVHKRLRDVMHCALNFFRQLFTDSFTLFSEVFVVVRFFSVSCFLLHIKFLKEVSHFASHFLRSLVLRFFILSHKRQVVPRRIFPFSSKRSFQTNVSFCEVVIGNSYNFLEKAGPQRVFLLMLTN